MAPKAFPLPISVGSDICQISRVGAIVHYHTYFNQFAKKTFNRLEWPALLGQIAGTRAQELSRNRDYVNRMDNKLPILHLPMISESSTILNGTEKTPEGKLVRYLAGRWAAKEAAIKAHRNRHLHMTDISVVKPRNEKPLLLVDPPCQYVIMNEDAARARGLREFNESASLKSLKVSDFRCYGDISNGQFIRSKNPNGTKFFRRRVRVTNEDRQLAELSISHDGEYAMAVCIAFDEGENGAREKPFVIDSGSGDPVHEPEWADEGWFGPTYSGGDDEAGEA